MKTELHPLKSTFKLDLIETANADPMLSPADLKVLVAYVSVMEWPSCRTWLATPLAMAMTGLSERQFRSSRSNLRGKNEAGRAYLTPARRGGKVVAYSLVNPWRDDALAHIEAMTGYYREAARQKKAAQRSVASRQNLPGQQADLSLQILPGQDGGCPGKICRSVPAKSAAYNPVTYSQKEELRRGEIPLGSNVVPLDGRRRRAS